MAELIEFETERLRLRQWTDADHDPFAALNADPRVMEFFPSPLTRAESDAMADRCRSLIEARGWGFWAAESKATREFIGFVGLHIPSADLPFAPCVEVGWRLAFLHWGKGFACEAARGALRVGFQSLGLAEIVAFTTVGNRRSRAVMERLGMAEAGGFEHPQVPADSVLRPHCLYRISRERHSAWRPAGEQRINPMKADRQADEVRIIDVDDTKVAVLEHRGDPRRVGRSVLKFIEWRRQNHLPPSISATFNILHGNPAEVAAEDFRLDICAAVDRDVADNPFGVVGGTIPAGRCAVLRHIGSDDALGETVGYLCSEWLPQSGEQRRDFPVYLQRVRFFPEVAESEAVTDVFLPLV